MKLTKSEWVNLYIGAVHHWNKIISFIIKHYEHVYKEDRYYCITDCKEHAYIFYNWWGLLYCKYFILSKGCFGCPVHLSTGGYECRRTPWHDFATSKTTEDLLKKRNQNARHFVKIKA